jgi:hypothetical protein
MTKLTFTINVELERTEGKFASRDEMAEEILGWLENANEGEVSGIGADCASTYEITAWDVEGAA